MRFLLISYFKRLDLFGSGVNFTFNGESSYRSVIGAMISIVVFFVTLLQLNVKWQLLVEKSDTRHQEWVEQLKDNGINDKWGF